MKMICYSWTLQANMVRPKEYHVERFGPPQTWQRFGETVFGPGQVRHQRYTKAVEIMAPRRWNPPVGWPKIGICFGKHGEARGF